MHESIKLLNSVNIEPKVRELAFAALANNSPIALYSTDKYGHFAGGNDVELKILKVTSLSEVIGKHLNEMGDHSAWKNSKMVMEANHSMILEEKGLAEIAGEEPYFLSLKTPRYDKQGRVNGITGISFDITANKHAEIAAQKKPFAIENVIKEITASEYYLKGQFQGLALSQREAQCIVCLARGYTIKQIAKILDITPRLTESCVAILKQKLHCNDRAELIAVAIECEFLEGIRPALVNQIT